MFRTNQKRKLPSLHSASNETASGKTMVVCYQGNDASSRTNLSVARTGLMHQVSQVRVGFIISEYSKVGLVVSFNNPGTPYDVATSHTQTVEEDPVRNNQLNGVRTHTPVSLSEL